ncbi:MAG: hypothetical protein C5B58_02825, partial [Acidobacteria bacterium]
MQSNIVQELEGVDALLWHWTHQDSRQQLMARQLISAAEAMGLLVFPGRLDCWHFDDKVAQKYLLEAVGAPFPETCVFYSLDQALEWINNATFPKVFKLRRGAAS